MNDLDRKRDELVLRMVKHGKFRYVEFFHHISSSYCEQRYLCMIHLSGDAGVTKEKFNQISNMINEPFTYVERHPYNYANYCAGVILFKEESIISSVILGIFDTNDILDVVDLINFGAKRYPY